jgi:hypothetical protein
VRSNPPGETSTGAGGWTGAGPDLDVGVAVGGSGMDRVEVDGTPIPPVACSKKRSTSTGSGMIRVLTRDVTESGKETTASPLKAALETLRALRPALPSVEDFGGLLPESHRDFLTRWAPMSFVLSAGPPVEQVEQLVALLAAGVLEVVGPDARFWADRESGCFAVESPAVPGSRRSAHVLLDARVPTTDLMRDRSPLVRQLRAEGMLSEYVNVGPGDRIPFHTGGLAVTPTPPRVVHATGHPDPDVYAIGVATEHTRWFTQVGTGRPGRDSPFCRDADG